MELSEDDEKCTAISKVRCISMEDYFGQLETELLKEDVSNFWNIDFENTTSAQIGNLYMQCFTQGKFKEIPLNYYGIYVDQGLKLYRIRKDIKDYLDIKSLQDFSYNPTPSKKGRFNKDMEKILYLSTNIRTPIREMDIKIGESFLLLEYEACEKIPLRPVNISNWYETDSPQYKEKVNILNNFVNQIMTVSIECNSSAYEITTLLKDYFPFSLYDEVVGWFYKSNKANGNNLALTYPKAKGFLKLTDFKIVKMGEEEIYMQFNRKVQQCINEIIDTNIII